MKVKYIDYLNASLTDTLSEEQAIDNYGHLAKKETIRHYHRNHMLGDLIKKKDPQLYQVGKNEYEREQQARADRIKKRTS